MRKVLHIIYDLSTAGAQTVAMNYVREMQYDKDFHLTLLVTEPFKGRIYEKEVKEKEFDYLCCNYKPYMGISMVRPIVNWFKYQYAIWKAIKQVEPDIIHSHLTNILPYVTLPAFFSGAKRVHTLHSDPYAISKKNVVWAWFAFHLFGFRAVGVTESQVVKAKKRYNLDDISIVHNGLNLKLYKHNPTSKQEMRRELGIGDDVFVIGSVGRFDRIKNYPFLIKLFAEYYNVNNHSRLLLVGDGSEKDKLLSLSESLGVKDYVIFAGQRSDVQNVYKAMDLFMLTSFFESSSIVTVEAQLSGLRCVISSSIPDSVVITNQVNRIDLASPLSEWLLAIKGKLEREPIKNNEFSFSIANTISELKEVYSQL